ncbi:MAG TPA: 50S ribosomal protein L20 [Candidatus Paceibacterota bacterium]
MPRVKRGTIATKHRRRVLKQVKGYRFGRSKKEREAKTALLHAGAHAFRHRREKKRGARALWQVKINAAVRPLGFSYSHFMGLLKKNSVELDRKILADLAGHEPATFRRIVESVTLTK